jgi:spectinomycin phosphotransferase
MLEPPLIAENKIIACMQQAYGLAVRQLTFLPLGADVNAAVYRLDALDGNSYFVKLKRGDFDETGVILPRFLHDQGISQVIAPLLDCRGQLWCHLQDFRVILYPYVEGRNGFETILSANQWSDFGTALKRIHTLQLPEALKRTIVSESYTPQYRDMVEAYLARAKVEVFADSVAIKVADLLQAEEPVILELIQRAEILAHQLQGRPNDLVLCHADAHAGNILVADSGALYIVDWDNPILALKERDLMFIGGAQGFRDVTAQEEEALFYRGYGTTQINPFALAYYRYERIIQDIAAYCEQLLDTTAGGDDREQSYRYLASNFLPGNTIEAATDSDQNPESHGCG